MFIDEKKIEFLVDYFIGKHTLSCMGLGLTPLQQEVQKTLVRTGRIEGHTGSQEASLMQKTGKPYREEGLTDFETRLVDSMKRDIAVVKSIADLVAKVLEIDAEKYTKKVSQFLHKKCRNMLEKYMICSSKRQAYLC